MFTPSSSSFTGILRIHTMTTELACLVQVAEALHRYRRGHGFESRTSLIFKALFRNCLSCVHNCNDHHVFLSLFGSSNKVKPLFSGNFVTRLSARLIEGVRLIGGRQNPFTLKMTSVLLKRQSMASALAGNNSSFQSYTHPDNHIGQIKLLILLDSK